MTLELKMAQLHREWRQTLSETPLAKLARWEDALETVIAFRNTPHPQMIRLLSDVRVEIVNKKEMERKAKAVAWKQKWEESIP